MTTPYRAAFALTALLPLMLAACGSSGGSSASPPTSVTLSATMTGSGTVTSSPSGIDCPTACSASFSSGATVTLTAAPASGSIIGAWGGACQTAGSAATCRVTPTQSQSVTVTFLASPPQSKPVLIGLETMGDESWFYVGSPQNRLLEVNAHPGVYSAAVIQATWSQLEPQPGVFDDSVINTALQNMQLYNATYATTPIVGKLRVFAGAATPAWVLQQVGSVQLVTKTGLTVTMPDWWTSAYSQLWMQLQSHLASVYDSNPLIGEVGVTSCSSFTGEPFIEGLANKTNVQVVLAAGYTDAAMQQCLSNAWNDYATWKTTPLDFPFSEFESVQTAPATLNTSFPIQLMQQFRHDLGVRAAVGSQGLNDPLGSYEQQIYDEFQSLYAAAQASTPPQPSPLEFQTAGPTVDFSTVIPFGISTYHPTEIELWNTTAVPGGIAAVTFSQLQQWAALIKSAN